MTARNSGLGDAFVEHQRRRLEALRDQNANREDTARAEEEDLEEQSITQVQDPGEAGANEAQRRIDDALKAESGRRADDIERALAKIEDGSYGLSDESGEPIPKERLEAVPEALRTVEEEGERDRAARHEQRS